MPAYISQSHLVVFIYVSAGEEVPRPCPLEKVKRVILAEKPRVTQFPIEWDSPPGQ